MGINLYVEVLLSPDLLDIAAIVNDSNPSVSIIVIACARLSKIYSPVEYKKKLHRIVRRI